MRIALLLLAACSGSKATTDDTDTPGTTPTGETGTEPPDVYPATWDGVQQLFTEHCDVCHPSEQGVDLHVVVENPTGYPYVVPGDPDNSYLWQVVSGQVILRMPPTGLLPAETVQCIHDWIEAGASFE